MNSNDSWKVIANTHWKYLIDIVGEGTVPRNQLMKTVGALVLVRHSTIEWTGIKLRFHMENGRTKGLDIVNGKVRLLPGSDRETMLLAVKILKGNKLPVPRSFMGGLGYAYRNAVSNLMGQAPQAAMSTKDYRQEEMQVTGSI